MLTAAGLVNRAATRLFDALFALPGEAGALAALVAVSTGCGLFALFVFARFSDQQRLRLLRRQVVADLLGMRLFAASARVFLRLFVGVLLGTLERLRLAVPPVLVMALPLALALVQLEGRCGRQAAGVGSPLLVKARVRDGLLAGGAQIVLRGPDGVAVETPAVRSLSLNEAAWRVRPLRAGRFALFVDFAGLTVDKELVAGRAAGFLSAVRTGGGWWRLLRHPGEEPIPDGPVLAVEVVYPPRGLGLSGVDLDWQVVFLAVAIGAAFAAKSVFKVELS